MAPRARAALTTSGLPLCRRAAAPRTKAASIRRGVQLAAVAAASLALGSVGLDAAQPGPLTRFMGAHVLLMNVAAPILALAVMSWSGRLAHAAASPASLAAATLAQLAALAAAHVPTILQGAAAAPVLHALMQVCLLAVALWFWLAVLATRGAQRWRSLVALALTAKLFCLLAALLVLAPRLLISGVAGAHGAHGADAALADQQLAGLLMLAACPLTYVVAGIVIAAQWLAQLAATDARAGLRDAADSMRVG